MCTLDLPSRVPGTCEHPTAPYTGPPAPRSPSSHTHHLLPPLSDYRLSSTAVTLHHTRFSAYLIGCALRGPSKREEKRVDNRAADDKRMEEGEKGQV